MSADNEQNKQHFIKYLESLLSYPDIEDTIRELYSDYSLDKLYIELYDWLNPLHALTQTEQVETQRPMS